MATGTDGPAAGLNPVTLSKMLKNKFGTMHKISLILAVLLLISACGDDFFVRPPGNLLTVEEFYQTEEDLFMATAPLYNIFWYDFIDNIKYELGDSRGGLMNALGNTYEMIAFIETADNPRLANAWQSFYKVIMNANMVIENIEERSSDDIARLVKDHRIAEARFMRGVAYLYLAQLWGHVPIIYNTQDLLDNPNVYRNFRDDVFQFAINDLKFAEENLVLEDVPGSVTTWSAKSMLARAYLILAYYESQGGMLVQEHLDLAREYAHDVIYNSPHHLMEDYADLFKRQYNNNPESIFALQWTTEGDFWGRQNMTQAIFAPEGRITGAGDGWGGAKSPSLYLIRLFDFPQSGDNRRKPTFMAHGDHYPEILQNQGGYTFERSGSRSTAIKKYVIGHADDNDGKVDFMTTDINTYMIRLAEVYLIYAEAILGNSQETNDSEAMRYFNKLRERAGVPFMQSITHRDILHERAREFAFEGKYWYELLKYFHWRPQEAIDYINNQERMTWVVYNSNDDPTTYSLRPPNETLTITESRFFMHYPEADASANPNLLMDPVPFDFDLQ